MMTETELTHTTETAVLRDQIRNLKEQLLQERMKSDRMEHTLSEILKRITHGPPKPHDLGYRKRKPRKAIPPLTRLAVFARDEWQCKVCGATDHLHIDHIHPVSKGGTDDLGNLQTLCRPCNISKGMRTDWKGTK